MKYFKRHSILILIALTVNFNLKAQHNKDSLLNQLSIKWINAKEYTLKIASLMPESEYNFKPVPDEMSFKEQLIHIKDNILWLSTTYLFVSANNVPNGMQEMNKANILKSLAEAYDQGLKAHTINTEKLNEIVNFFAGPKSRRQMLILMHDHQAHHVGQLIVYLRLKGLKPPEYIGW